MKGLGSSVFHFRCLDDSIESGFRQATTVEQHGILGPAGDRQVAAPRLAVMHAPKRNPAELVPVFPEKRKQIAVPFGLVPLNGVRQAVRIRIEFHPRFCVERGDVRNLGIQMAKRKHTDIQFGDHQFYIQLGERQDIGFDLLDPGIIVILCC